MTSKTEQLPSLSQMGDADIVRALVSAIATVTIVGVGLSLTTALLGLRLAEQGFSARAIGFHATTGGLAVMAGAASVPALARRYRIRPLLFFALLLSGMCLLCFPLTSDYWAWLLIRTVFNWALSLLFVTSEYWINAMAPPRLRGFVLGFYMTSLSGGFAAGPFILGLVGIEGAAPFLVAAALFALAVLPVLLRGGQPPEIMGAAAVRVWPFLT
ncbi:MAG TPA: MFS transporter, partial [Methylocella sp.]|nr:MFS transporter [Methylocella sp.]